MKDRVPFQGSPTWVRVLHRALYAIFFLALPATVAWAVHVDRAVSKIPEIRDGLGEIQGTCVRRDDIQELRAVQLEAAGLRGELEGLRASVGELRGLVQAILVEGARREEPRDP